MLTFLDKPFQDFQERELSISNRAQPDWAYEFPDRTGLDIQICRTGPARQVLPDWTKSGLILLNILHTNYGLPILFR